jgi:hypothetical protein
MKKILFGIAFFALNFILSSELVRFLNLSTTNQTRPRCVEEVTEFKSDPPPEINRQAEISIKFREFVTTEYYNEAKFEITNNGDKSVFYGYPNVDIPEPLFICNELMIDGRQIGFRTECMGLEDRELKPGGSKVFFVSVNYWHWQKDKSYRVGFNFKQDGETVFKTYWSENLPISGAVKNRLLQEQKKYGVE